jgi:hypothetical protein
MILVEEVGLVARLTVELGVVSFCVDSMLDFLPAIRLRSRRQSTSPEQNFHLILSLAALGGSHEKGEFIAFEVQFIVY